jgi:hypothetical protein
MVAGGEHCQLRAAIEVLVPYSFVPVFAEARFQRLPLRAHDEVVAAIMSA